MYKKPVHFCKAECCYVFAKLRLEGMVLEGFCPNYKRLLALNIRCASSKHLTDENTILEKI